jgi:hypothetical protein
VAASAGVKQLGRETEHLVRTLRMSGDIMSGDIMSGDIMSGDIMSGDIMSGDIMSGDIMSGDMSGDIIPLLIRLCSQWITSHFIFYGYRI